MATLEERIQNLTQDINPMGAMSDMDAERLMIIQQPQEFISTPKGQSTKLRMEAMLRLPKGSLSDSDALRMLQMMGGELNTQALPSVYETMKNLVGDLRNQTVGPGVMTDRDAQRVMQALGGNNNTMPIGSGVMTEMDAQRVMAALGDNNRAGRIFEDNENFFREMRIGDEVVYKGDNQVMSQDVFRAENPYARPTVASESTRGTMSDIEGDMVMNAMPSNPMQPLVEMGFGEQVDIILGNPADSDISRQAQQQIINEMGTGMDIDSFLMEVNNLAPKGAMTNIDAEGINELMRFCGQTKSRPIRQPIA
jgi:hypothetical protein